MTRSGLARCGRRRRGRDGLQGGAKRGRDRGQAEVHQQGREDHGQADEDEPVGLIPLVVATRAIGCHRVQVSRTVSPGAEVLAYRERMPESEAPPGLAWLVTVRDAVRRWPGGWLLWRIAVTVAGLAVIVIGVVLIPLPGPGWLIVFLGLGIWSTEYAWARRLTTAVRRLVGRWWLWMARRPRWAQVAVAIVGVAFTVAVSFAAWYLF